MSSTIDAYWLSGAKSEEDRYNEDPDFKAMVDAIHNIKKRGLWHPDALRMAEMMAIDKASEVAQPGHFLHYDGWAISKSS